MRLILSASVILLAAITIGGRYLPAPLPVPAPAEVLAPLVTPTTKIIPQHLSAPILAAAMRYDLDPALLAAVAYKESRFRDKVCSGAGACGLMQFMPETAVQYRVDRGDALSSLDGAARYLRYLLKLHNKNTGLALAAYNWGEGNVAKWRKAGSKVERMPRETRDYVLKITGQGIKVWAGKTKNVGDLLSSLALDDYIRTMDADLDGRL